MLQKRARVDVATQACETCRRRKTKCDEQRPKCSLCIRLNTECVYKPPPPPRTEESMNNILDTIERLENKFDQLNMRLDAPDASVSPPSKAGSSSQATPSSWLRGEFQSAMEISNAKYGAKSHLTVPHKIMFWPRIRSLLMNSGTAGSQLEEMYERGTAWLLRQEFIKYPDGVPFDTGLRSLPIDGDDSGQSAFFSGRQFPGLTKERISSYIDAYFNTFNVLHPILDYEQFMEETLPPLINDGFRYADYSSVLALLVFALGELAIQGTSGQPIGIVNGSASGIRGGTDQRAPGIEIFNEARARLGSIPCRCELQCVQILLLQAFYFEASACHVEYWRATSSASLACQALIKSMDLDWDSANGDLVKRAYWTCVINEDLYHLDLDLTKTGISDMEDTVPFPHFHQLARDSHQETPAPNAMSVQYYFIARITLRTIVMRIHEVVYLHSYQAESYEDYIGPPEHVITELGRQLETWRSSLPVLLQWSDHDILEAKVDENPKAFYQGLVLLLAEFRMRFYQARFVLYRPFVFKALHFPARMTTRDVEYYVVAMKSACLWPLATGPANEMKRLIPHLFTWTQHFIGVFLLLWVVQNDEPMYRAYMAQLGQAEMQQTTSLILRFVEDVKQVDGITEWIWKMLEPLFPQQSL